MGGLIALPALAAAGAGGAAAATGAATAAGLGGLAGAGALGAGAAGLGAAGTAAGLGAAGTAAGLGAGATAAGIGAGGAALAAPALASTAVPAAIGTGLAAGAPAAASIGTGLAAPTLGAAATGAELGGLATGGLATSIGPGLGSAAAVGSELSKALIAAQATAAGTAAQTAGVGTGLAGAAGSGIGSIAPAVATAPQAVGGLSAALPEISPAIGGAVNPAISGMATQGALGSGLASQGVMGVGPASTAATQLNAVAPATSFSNALSQAPQVFEGTLGAGPTSTAGAGLNTAAQTSSVGQAVNAGVGKAATSVMPQAQAQISTQQLISAAKVAYPNNPVMGKVAVSQSMLESGLPGKGSALANQGNNLFGIKGSGTAGSMNMPTKEFVGGRMVTQNASFAKNASLSDSFAQHAKLMAKPRYEGVMNANSTQQATQALQKAGYATDPNYPAKLNNIINRIGPMYDKAAISPQSMNTIPSAPQTNVAMANQSGGLPSINSPNVMRTPPSVPNPQEAMMPNRYVSQVSNLPGQGAQPQTTFFPKMANVKADLTNPAGWTNNSLQAQAEQVGYEPAKFASKGEGLNIVPRYEKLPEGAMPSSRGMMVDMPSYKIAPNNILTPGQINQHLPVTQSGEPISQASGISQAPPTTQDVVKYGRFNLFKGDTLPFKNYAPGLHQYPIRPDAPVYQNGMITGRVPTATETGAIQQQISQPQAAISQQGGYTQQYGLTGQELERLNTPELQQRLFSGMTEGQGSPSSMGINPNPPHFDPMNEMKLFGKTFDKRDVQELGGLVVAGSGKMLGTMTGAKMRGGGGGELGPAGEENDKGGYYYQDVGNFNDMYGQYYDFNEK